MYILKPAHVPHADTQSPDVIAYLPVDCTISQMSLCTGLAVYNQLKKAHYEWGHICAGSEKSVAGRRVGVLQIAFWLSK